MDPVQQISDLTGGVGVHFAFEAIGLVEGPFVQSILCTRRRGEVARSVLNLEHVT